MKERPEARWRLVRRPGGGRMPYALRRWVLCEGSLTAQVVRRCGAGRFSLGVLSQDWGRPLPSERRLLRLRGGERVLVREVELRCGGMAWVYARTLIPAATLNGPLRRLARLGNRPLGHLLFNDPRTRRGITEAARIEPHQAVFPPQGAAGPVWGRRTLFHLAGEPLLINEVFLPAIQDP